MTTWKNWAGDETCTPAAIERPESVDDVCAAVRRAVDAGRTVRVAGAGHSFGDLVCTDGVLMSLDALSGLQQVDRERGLVRVAAGTQLHALNRVLDAEGLAFANLGDIDVQSVAGAVSTGTHGTGKLIGNLATMVESLQLVTAGGAVLELTGDDAENLAAARISLGALGVVTAYTLRVVPSFNLRGVDQPMPLGEVMDGLDDLVDGNDHFEFFWFPHTSVALTRRNNRTDEEAAPEGKVAAYVRNTLVENQLLDLVCRTGRRFPGQIPRLNRLVTRALTPATRVDKSYRIFASQRSVRFTETEWAVPRSELEATLTELQDLVQGTDYAVNFPFEVRFVAGDEASLLSPAYGRESAYIAMHCYQGMPWQDFFRRAQEIAVAHGGRPHWGKRHSLDASTLATLYPEWDRFQEVRSTLDPDGVFANDHLRRVFEAR
ncbi:D-arabinono-1,4-lactone oxidase [Nocardioides cavernaquae]|uniref:FAD-binding protein n=1 Tax=Nocardioides cavernaquae TaxID=2321396 RepID=A0A3A5HFS0_9ACTN|nr:D-arabinono-1,4-lactone oxidase [Nocardioides cavernaquae]RJS46810.1 FAD-binding protein [Nocardioides cavernaquae]